MIETSFAPSEMKKDKQANWSYFQLWQNNISEYWKLISYIRSSYFVLINETKFAHLAIKEPNNVSFLFNCAWKILHHQNKSFHRQWSSHRDCFLAQQLWTATNLNMLFKLIRKIWQFIWILNEIHLSIVRFKEL